MREVSDVLARYVSTLKYFDLPSQVVQDFKRALLDYLCSAVTGSQTEVSKGVLNYLKEIDHSPVASVIGSETRLSPLNAALANGTSTHALDFDDGHTQASFHPAGPNFPAVFAVAEQYRVDVRAVILAAVLAYDVSIRISAAIHPAATNRGFHNTAIAGVFGATAGVASLLKLDYAQTLNALGLAGSFAGGLFEFLGEGADIKRIHPGKAARDGILCAELAKRGITGPARVLEGRFGFFKAYADSVVDYDRLTINLGENFEISKVYFKPYPACRHLHAPIEGIKRLKQQRKIRPEEIKKIEVGIYAVGARHAHKQCDKLLDAQMSIPCAVALALSYDDVTLQSFQPGYVDTPEVKDLIEKVQVVVSEECERAYPAKRSAIVTVELEDSKLTAKIENPLGEPDNPLTDVDLEKKFLSNCIPILGQNKCQRLIEAVWNFENLTSLEEFYSWRTK